MCSQGSGLLLRPQPSAYSTSLYNAILEDQDRGRQREMMFQDLISNLAGKREREAKNNWSKSSSEDLSMGSSGSPWSIYLHCVAGITEAPIDRLLIPFNKK